MLRSSGHYGPKVEPSAEDADTQTKLIAFTGRDPNWTATSTNSNMTRAGFDHVVVHADHDQVVEVHQRAVLSNVVQRFS